MCSIDVVCSCTLKSSQAHYNIRVPFKSVVGIKKGDQLNYFDETTSLTYNFIVQDASMHFVRI